MSSFGGYGPLWMFTLTLTVVCGRMSNGHVQPGTLLKYIWDELSLWSAQGQTLRLWGAMTAPLLASAYSFELEDMVD